MTFLSWAICLASTMLSQALVEVLCHKEISPTTVPGHEEVSNCSFMCRYFESLGLSSCTLALDGGPFLPGISLLLEVLYHAVVGADELDNISQINLILYVI